MARTKQVTKLFPEPPPTKRRKALNVEIDGAISMRIKAALLVLESEGQVTPQYAFVERLLERGLDEFDEERRS